MYIFYVLSFTLDFIPAVRTKPTDNRFPTIEEMRQADTNGPSVSGGPVYAEDGASARAYAEGHPHGMQQQSGYPTYAAHDTPRDSYASSSRPMMHQVEPEQPQYPARAF